MTDVTYDVVAITDGTGAVVERFLYDPYGKSTVLDPNFAVDSDSLSDYDWETRFTSREFDKETGLDYFRARYYHSGVARFVNRDPLEYPDGYNAYAGYFVPGGMDPSGTKTKHFLIPGGASTNYTPTQATGMPWNKDLGPDWTTSGGLPSHIGVRTYINKLSIKCDYDICGILSCEVVVDIVVWVNPTNASGIGLTGRTAYGHEQRHVQNILDRADFWVNRIDSAFDMLIDGTVIHTCEDFRDYFTKTANDDLNGMENHDAEHKSNNPMEGKGYDPLDGVFPTPTSIGHAPALP